MAPARARCRGAVLAARLQSPLSRECRPLSVAASRSWDRFGEARRRGLAPPRVAQVQSPAAAVTPGRQAAVRPPPCRSCAPFVADSALPPLAPRWTSGGESAEPCTRATEQLQPSLASRSLASCDILAPTSRPLRPTVFEVQHARPSLLWRRGVPSTTPQAPARTSPLSREARGRVCSLRRSSNFQHAPPTPLRSSATASATSVTCQPSDAQCGAAVQPPLLAAARRRCRPSQCRTDRASLSMMSTPALALHPPRCVRVEGAGVVCARNHVAKSPGSASPPH